MSKFPRLILGVFVAAVFLSMSSSMSAQDGLVVFRNKFQKAVDANDFSEQRRIVKNGRGSALSVCFGWERDYAKARLAGKQDLAEKVKGYIDALASNFSVTFRDDIISRRFKFINSLSDDQLAGRLDAIRFETEGYNFFNDAKKAGDKDLAKQAQDQFIDAYNSDFKIEDYLSMAFDAKMIAETFVLMGDHDFDVVYWSRVAVSAAKKGGFEDRLVSAESLIQEYKKKGKVRRPDLIDLSLPVDESKVAYEKAYADSLKVKTPAGGGSVSAGDGQVLVPPESKAAYEWAEDMGFKPKVLPIGSKIWLPSFSPQQVQATNPSINPLTPLAVVKKDAEPVDGNGFLPGAKLKYDGKLFIDPDGDDGKQKFKKMKLKVDKPGKNKFKVVYDDDTRANLTYMMFKQSPSQKAFGVSFKGQGAEKLIVFRWYNVTGMKGKIRGHDVTFVDANSNGYYFDTGADCVLIGSGKKQRIEPLGRFIFLEEEGGLFPYELKIAAKNCSVVRTRPFSGELAPIKVEYKTGSGAMPQSLFARGSGENTEAYIDLMNAIDKPLWIPAGRWRIHKGVFVLDKKGKKTILIGPGRSGDFQVATGKLNVWKLGGAGKKGFWMLGKVERGEKRGTLKAVGKEIRVYGNFGEEYYNFLADRLTVDVTVRKGSKDGSKVASATMKPHPGSGNFTVADLFFPESKIIKNVPGRGELFVKMTAKHPILGHIESDWFKVE